MAGINRLGKAPPRPGSLRVPDRNRNVTVVQYSGKDEEDILTDKDYQRTVQDIEDATQQQGWLFSRGAFDKTDLLYLRDQEEKSRHTEMELHDKEVMSYAEMRARAERDRRSVAERKPAVRKDLKQRSAVPKPPINRVVVRAAAAVHGGKADGNLEPPAKRLKAAAAQASGLAPAAASPSASDSSADGGALAGLLGDYGSDSDSGNEDADDAEHGGGKALSPAEEGGDKDAVQVAKEEPVSPAGAKLTADRQALEGDRIQSLVLNAEEAEVLLDYE